MSYITRTVDGYWYWRMNVGKHFPMDLMLDREGVKGWCAVREPIPSDFLMMLGHDIRVS